MSTALSRRAFISAVSAAAASAALPRAASAGQFTGKIKKAVRYNMFAGGNNDKMSDADRFGLLKQAGFEGVELVLAGLKSNPEALVKAAADTGLKIHGVNHDGGDDLDFSLESCKFFGCDSILYVARYNQKNSYKRNWDAHVEILKKAIPKAEKYGVKINIEEVWATFLIDPTAMALFIDQFKSPFIQAYFDIGNVMRWGYPPHWIEVLGPRIQRLHVKEVSMKKMLNEGLGKCFDVEIGDGDIDWPGVRKALSAVNYTGWASAEVKVRGDSPLEGFTDIARRMDKVLDL